MDEARSKHGSLVRLTDERWAHIVEGHNELAGMREDVLESIAFPDRVLMGRAGELLAVRQIGIGKWMVAVYRELDQDGFVITAFTTSRVGFLDKRQQVWPLK